MGARENFFPPGMDEETILWIMTTLYYNCKEVNFACPIELTTLGYYPNRRVNALLAICYLVTMVLALGLGVRGKTWSYTAFLAAGCALDVIGYGGRVALSFNPWNRVAYEIQIITIILAPTLLCASIYLTLKHICLALNPSLSRVRPYLYPLVFVPADVACLIIQTSGGGLAIAGATKNFALVEHGNRATLAGILLQVAVLGFFGVVGADYFVRVKKWIASGQATPQAIELWNDKKFRRFTYGVTGAYVCIMIRCIYRIAEMSGGWGGPIMRDQVSFIILEGVMTLIGSFLLAAFSPGYLFPQMAAPFSAWKKDKPSDVERQAQSSGEDGERSEGQQSPEARTSGDEAAAGKEKSEA